MVVSAALVQDSRFKVGWITLLILAGLMVVMHAGLAFARDDATLFTTYTLFSIYAFIVLAVPFHQGEKWAWYATWLVPIGLVLPAYLTGNPQIGMFYYVMAAIAAVGLLLTMRSFFTKR